MKSRFIIALSALVLFASCEEFEPVVTLKYQNPEPYQFVEGLQANTTIASLVSTYTHEKPFVMGGGKIIAGRVISTDKPGNFYKSLYIQDATGGIELKIGKNGLYNDYLPGQMLYVDCDGLYLGEYGYKSGSSYGNGMVQIGYDGTGTDYETSYLENPLLIDAHILRGDPSDIQPVEPVVVPETSLPINSSTQSSNKYIGQLVTIKNLSYGWYDSRYSEQNEAFVLLYLDSNKNKKDSQNRIFVSGSGTGITTWAMSKDKMTQYLYSGIWDNINIGNANDYTHGKVGDHKGDGTYPTIEKASGSVSQYFSTPNGTCVQVRTSGYCKFADVEIPAAVLQGTQTIDVTGVLCLYQGKIQITVNSIDDIKFN